MVQFPDSLRLLFESSLQDSDDGYTITIPNELIENGSLREDAVYRIALLEAPTNDSAVSTKNTAGSLSTGGQPTQSTTGTEGTTREQEYDRTQWTNSSQGPPVTEGETRMVAIDSLGEQGDGIAKVENGFVIIVSDTQPGDHVEVEVTTVKETVAFAEPISEPTVR